MAKDKDRKTYRYGYCGPTTQGFLVLQDKKGHRTTVVTNHSLNLCCDNTRFIGQVTVIEGYMTLHAEVAPLHKADREGTIRMKNVILM